MFFNLCGSFCYWMWINSPKVVFVCRNVNEIKKIPYAPHKIQKFAEMKNIPYFLPVVYHCTWKYNTDTFARTFHMALLRHNFRHWDWVYITFTFIWWRVRNPFKNIQTVSSMIFPPRSKFDGNLVLTHWPLGNYTVILKLSTTKWYHEHFLRKYSHVKIKQHLSDDKPTMVPVMPIAVRQEAITWANHCARWWSSTVRC